MGSIPSTKYVKDLVKHFRAHKDVKLGDRMYSYMRSQFPFIGLQSPKRKELLKEFIKNNGRPNNDKEILEIFKMKEREFKYIAIELAAYQIQKTKNKDRIKLYEEMASHEQWWDTIDILASKCIGGHFKLFPDQITEYTNKWIKSDSFWFKRICIIFQLTYKRDTDIELLFSFIEPNLMDKEFFIAKGIAWSLRELSKTHHNIVFDFMEKHNDNLSPLIKREGSKYLKKKKIKE